MATWFDVGQELKTIFPSIGTNGVFYYYCKIGEILSTPAQVEKGCAALEKAMIDIVDGRRLPQQEPVVRNGMLEFPNPGPEAIVKSFNDRGNAFKTFLNPKSVASYPEQDDDYKKLYSKCLSAALAAEEEKSGFDADVGYIYGGLEAVDFLNLLRQKRVFKDLGASVYHGEFTHRIQWYILSKQLFNSTELASIVYASLADWIKPKGKSDAQEKVCGRTCTSVWDALFDRAPNTGFKDKCLADNDFRSPNNLFTWLREGGGSKKFPVLSAFLQSRFLKRSGGDNTDGPTAQLMAAALKLFKHLDEKKIDLQKTQNLVNAGFVTRAHIDIAKSQAKFGRDLSQARALAMVARKS